MYAIFLEHIWLLCNAYLHTDDTISHCLFCMQTLFLPASQRRITLYWMAGRERKKLYTKSLPSLFASFLCVRLCVLFYRQTQWIDGIETSLWLRCSFDEAAAAAVFVGNNTAITHIYAHTRHLFRLSNSKNHLFRCYCSPPPLFLSLFLAVIVVDVNSEYSLSLLCMDTLFLSFDYRIRQNKYKSKSF